MVRSLLLVGVFALVFTSCDFKSNKDIALQHEADSLRHELEITAHITDVLMDVGVIIDSIDASRNLITTGGIEGVPHDDYVSRLQSIWNHIDRSNKKIENLESTLAESHYDQTKNLETIQQLKESLLSSQAEIIKLTEQLTSFQEENAELMNTIAKQGAILNDKMQIFNEHQEEVAKLQENIQEITVQGKVDLAEAYYKQGEAMEEAAKRTKLAPHKKKETQRKALELYKLSLEAGKAEARQKIEELEKAL